MFPCAFTSGSGCRLAMILGMTKIKNGTVMPAIMLYTAESVARFVSSSSADRKANYAPYISSSTKIEVSVGSQFQNEHQFNFAQIDPVIVARRQYMRPSPAEETDTIS